jgi:tetratricopeptide (TPR) repeat protein
VLVELIELFPKKSYWMQLAAVYAETGRHEKALTTVELVYMQGLLDQKGEYMTLAQMYLYNQIPYEAAELLKDGLDKGVLEKDAKTLQLLADSWLHARERERALVPLRQAAELSEDGNVYVRLGQILIDREDWAGAREALAAAIDKGELRHPGHARLLLGIANANEERWGEAERAFVAAREDEKTEKAANYWLQHLASRRSAAEQRAAASTDSEARPS